MIQEFRTKSNKLKQEEDALNHKSKLIAAREQELAQRELEINKNNNEENEKMLDRIKLKLEKINIKEKELEEKLNSDSSFKGYESRISDLEKTKKDLMQHISELEIKNDAY